MLMLVEGRFTTHSGRTELSQADIAATHVILARFGRCMPLGIAPVALARRPHAAG
jgi:hypothetical protein